jgi:hypothetical protein
MRRGIGPMADHRSFLGQRHVRVATISTGRATNVQNDNKVTLASNTASAMAKKARTR